MQTQFELNHLLPLPLDRVQSFLADLQAFGDLHPLIELVENQGHSRYMIHEFKPLFFGVKARFKYSATVIVNTAEKLIVYEAAPMGMAIVIQFRLQPGPDVTHTQVMETVSIKGSRLFIGALKKAMIESHSAVFLKLRYLEKNERRQA